MVFELWSVMHFLYMLSPIILFGGICFLVRGRSEKVKNIVALVFGALSVFIIVIRNVDIFVRTGWDLAIIPLQVCHIAGIVAGLALITRKKWLIATTFCFNMIPAFLAMVFADSPANYDILLKIRPQTYVWGHILIVVCALSGMFILLPRLSKRDLIISLSFVGSMALVAVICNSAFRTTLGWTPNYFYLYDYKGTPLKFLYQALPTSNYGWFSINRFYTLVLILFFAAVFIGLYYIGNLIVKKLCNKSHIGN